MSSIIEDYVNLVESNKDILPDEVFKIVSNVSKLQIDDLVPDEDDRKKYFINGYRELSQSVFNFLHSGRGGYIINYVNEYNVNRLSAGFKKIEELVHFSIWVIQEFYKNRQTTLDSYNELVKKDKLLNKQQILEKIIASNYVKEKIENLNKNMKDHNDFIMRNALIKLREEYETFAEAILSAQSFYKQIDRIYVALSSINNICELNKIPDPVKQNFSEHSRVM